MDNTFRYLNTNILIIGTKESGKTCLVRDIYRKIQSEINEVHVFSNVTSCYSDITNAIYNDYSLLNSFVLHNNSNKNKLVIIENLIDKEQIKKLDELLYHGKHYNITTIITISNPMVMIPEFRNQFSYVFTSSYDFYSDQKKLHDYYFYMYHSFDYFREQILKLQKYEFLGVKIQSSPYAIVFKPELHTDLRFIPTNKYYGELNNSKEELLNDVINIVGDMVESLNKLTDILKKLKNN